jgi:hypothetical protein
LKEIHGFGFNDPVQQERLRTMPVSAFMQGRALQLKQRWHINFLKISLFLASFAIVQASFTLASDLIEPGDRLEIRYAGTNYSGGQISVVTSNGTIRIEPVRESMQGAFRFAQTMPVRVQGLSTTEAADALRASVEKNDPLQKASIRKIAPVPAPLTLSVFQKDETNLIFRITNLTTNSFRIPSDGYAQSDYFMPVNINPAYARVDKPELHTGLWLTRYWHYVGVEWMEASHDAWEHRLKIRVLKPGEHIDISRALNPFATEASSNTVFRFSFQIPQEWAENYGLWEGSLSVTGLSKDTAK